MINCKFMFCLTLCGYMGLIVIIFAKAGMYHRVSSPVSQNNSNKFAISIGYVNGREYSVHHNSAHL